MQPSMINFLSRLPGKKAEIDSGALGYGHKYLPGKIFRLS